MQAWITISKRAFKPGAVNRVRWATGMAVLFHLTGLLGMVFVDRDFFAALTPFNLLLMSFLNVWAGKGAWKSGLLFPLCIYATGMIAEIIGVRTGLLFGSYAYGPIFGPKLLGVPLLIGMNWFLVVSGALGIAGVMHGFANRIQGRQVQVAFSRLAPISRVVTAALLAVIFDRVMEPVAVKLGFWSWTDGSIPLFNYFSWFLVSLFMLLVSRRFNFSPQSGFTANLYLIQVVFFLLLGMML